MVKITDIQENPLLTSEEKVLVLEKTSIKNIIPNVGDFLADNFKKLDGFDYRWSSLITSQPLLFEDVDYLRVKPYIDEKITQKEIDAYKSGELRELYNTFESMLVCNLVYYDRIISFCTIAFLHYARVSDSETSTEGLKDTPYFLSMTPTQIWCCALTNTSSTKFELEYAWNLKLKIFNGENSLLEQNWKQLYKNNLFARFTEYSAIRCNTNGFRETLISDKTSNRKLAQVCNKFTRTSTAISEDSLATIYNYVSELESVEKKLYIALFTSLMQIFNDSTKFAIYVFTNEFYLYTAKFSMKVTKTIDGRIIKDYLGNTYECFAAEEYLATSIKYQIEWAKYRIPSTYDFDKQILKSLLYQMIKDSNYKNILAIKRMNEYGILSKITFSGVFNNLYIKEEFMFENRVIKTHQICLSKRNAANYVIDRGYFIFGIDTDVYNLAQSIQLNSDLISKHYTNYTIPVIKHMSEVIQLYVLTKNDIIDVVCNGILNPNKLNNQNIKFTNVKSDIIKSRNMLTNLLAKNTDNKKSYWKIIE